MKCWRIDLWRDFAPYLGGELTTEKVARFERHLLDCGKCRARLAHLRDGHRIAQNIPRREPVRDGWAAIEAMIKAERGKSRPAQTRAGMRFARLRLSGLYPRLALGLALLALSAAAMVAALKWQPSPTADGPRPDALADLDLRDFHAVSIADISRNTEPHIVAEGYVSELRVDRDGDMVFRLVEDVREGGPFIICEIVSPIKLSPPAVGSRVRVYGVSRFDSKANHLWHEVHPVLSIETLRD
jgi:putative zinc finger protein